jgi:hypothetical protein
MACTAALLSIHCDAELRDAMKTRGACRLFMLTDGSAMLPRGKPFVVRFMERMLLGKRSKMTKVATFEMLQTVVRDMEDNVANASYAPVWSSFYGHFKEDSWGRAHPKQWMVLDRCGTRFGEPEPEPQEDKDALRALEDSLDSDCAGWDSEDSDSE